MQYLKALTPFQDEKYRIFHQNLLTEGLPVLGVRTPDVRAVAKREEFSTLFENIERDEYHEQRMVRLFLLAHSKMDEQRRIELINKILPFVNSWALTDSFVCALKSAKKEKDLYMSFIKEQSKSTYSYQVRFALVMINFHFHDELFLELSESIIENIHSEEKEIVMAKAWAIVTLLSHHPHQVLAWYKRAPIEKIVHTWVMQKARDSRLVDKNSVEEIGMKKAFIS